MKTRNSILLFSFYLFTISLFLDRIINAYSAGIFILALVTITYGSLKSKIQLFKTRKAIWFMFGFAGMLVLSAFISEDHHAAAQLLQRRIPLILFPLSIGLIELNEEMREKILTGFAKIVAFVCFLTFLYALFRFSKTSDHSWLYNDGLSYLTGQQSIYTSVVVNISIYIFGYYLFFRSLSPGIKTLYTLSLIFLLVISYLLASRNMMLILYVSILIFSFYIIIKRRKYLEGLTLVLGMVIAGFLIFKFFPKTINRFRELRITHFNYENKAKESHYNMDLTSDQWNGANFRLAAWPCGWQVFKENPIVGVGLGDKKNELFKVYEEKKFHFALSTRKNVHNNYLDILLSTGIIGFLLFFGGWILFPMITAIKKKDGLAIVIFLTIDLAMLTENYFDRSLGAALFAFFICFFLTANKKTNEPI